MKGIGTLKAQDFVFATPRKDQSKKVPFIVLKVDSNLCSIYGDGLHVVNTGALTPATEEDFDAYWGDAAPVLKKYAKQS